MLLFLLFMLSAKTSLRHCYIVSAHLCSVRRCDTVCVDEYYNLVFHLLFIETNGRDSLREHGAIVLYVFSEGRSLLRPLIILLAGVWRRWRVDVVCVLLMKIRLYNVYGSLTRYLYDLYYRDLRLLVVRWNHIRWLYDMFDPAAFAVCLDSLCF